MASKASRTQNEHCGGCGALVDVDAGDGPRHAYMPAHPQCWAMMCALEDWRIGSLASGSVTVVQDLVDAYAAQHPNSTERRNRQSVAIHLMSICADIENGLDGAQRRARIGRWAHRDYPALIPTPLGYAVTVSDVLAAPTERRSERVAEMAASTWTAWSDHHEAIRAWLASTWH